MLYNIYGVSSVPPYQGFHLVVPDWWSYIAANNKCQLVNLAVSPLYHAAVSSPYF